MKRLLATTAIALLVAGPIAAQEQAPAAGTEAPATSETTAPAAVGILFLPSQEQTDYLSSNLVGTDVYSSQTDYDADYADNRPVAADARSQWDNIGEIGDLLISADGQVKAVLVDVGGFLGIGAHTVALDMNEVNILTDESGARFAAVNSSQEELENAPAFERQDQTAAMDGAPAATDGTMGAAPSATGTMAAGDTAMEPAPADTMAADGAGRDGYVPMAAEELTADRLEGATVYSAQDESIGDIAQLNLDQDGQISEAIVDVGGFLGMGAHSVAIAFDEMNVVNDPETGEVRVYIDATREDLEQRPEYQG